MKGIHKNLLLTSLSVMLPFFCLEIYLRLTTPTKNLDFLSDREAFSEEEEAAIIDRIRSCNLQRRSQGLEYKKLYFFNSDLPDDCKNLSSETIEGKYKIRRTINPSADKLTNRLPKTEGARSSTFIWLFGGSTMFSQYTLDHDTIPSHLSKLLHERGQPVTIRNFGTSGIDSQYELNNLTTLLINLEEKPDLVLFYDGFNDGVTSSAFNGDHVSIRLAIGTGLLKGLNYNLNSANEVLAGISLLYKKVIYKRVKFGVIANIIKGPDSKSIDPINRAGFAANRYCRSIKLAGAMLKASGIDSIFILQPMLHERDLADKVNSKFAGLGRKTYSLIRDCAKQQEGFYDASKILNKSKRRMFYDDGHLGAAGNKTVAKHLASIVDSHLKLHTVNSFSDK